MENLEGRKKPANTAFKQQNLPACRPILTPLSVAFIFLMVGIPFVVIGKQIQNESNKVVEVKSQYDGAGTPSEFSACRINSAGESKNCEITIKVHEDMTAPVYLYYQLTNFYQNHRKYVKSMDRAQLMGCSSKSSSGKCASYKVETMCDPLVKNGSKTLSPCGLIANSIFNDVVLVTSPQTATYTGIAWQSDKNKYSQPDGFKTGPSGSRADPCLVGKPAGSYHKCSDSVCQSAFGDNDHKGCVAYTCPSDSNLANYYGCNVGESYISWYPEDSTTQFFYESFPEVTTPMAGIENERFYVWMRTAALPKFRKLYAVIKDDISAGDTVTLSITANFDVSKFDGTKSLILTTTTWFGGKNSFLGVCFMVVGSLCIALGLAFLVKRVASPRTLGDLRFLQ